MRRLLPVLALAAAALAPPALAAPDMNKVIREVFPVAETGFDPAAVHDLYSGTVIQGIFDTLYTYDYLARPVKIKPQLTTGLPEVSADFQRYTLRLRPGILFADDAAFGGQPRELTAADLAYSLKRHFDPRWKSPRYNGLRDERIAGLEALRKRAVDSGKPFDYDAPIDGLVTPDRYTLQIALERPSPRFSYLLAHPGVSGVVAREVVERYGDATGEHPVGTGPFRLAQWRRSSFIALERNLRFRDEVYDESGDDDIARPIAAQLKGRKLPMVDRVEISIIEQSQPLWLSFLANQFEFTGVPYEFATVAVPGGKLAPNLAARGLRVHRMPRADIAYTYFNMEDPVVGGYTPEQVALRRAISLAYDTDSEIRLLRKHLAIPAQALSVPQTFGYRSDWRSEMSEYSPARARALLDLYGYRDVDGDGWRERPDGSRLELELHINPGDANRQFAEMWKKGLDAVGVRLKFGIGQWPEQLKSARAGKLQMWFLGNTAGSPDSQDILATAFGGAKGADNLCRFDLPQFNRIYERIQQLPDGPDRQAAFDEANRLLVAYMPMKAQVHRLALTLTQPWFVGYRPHPFLYSWWRYVDIDPEQFARASA
jgi:ABC-type transport system substrate-binding protein